jgi:hypothetical protein
VEQIELEVLYPLAVVGFVFDLLGEVEFAEQAGHTTVKIVYWQPGGEKISRDYAVARDLRARVLRTAVFPNHRPEVDGYM